MLEPTDKAFQQNFYVQFQASRASSYLSIHVVSSLNRVDPGLADRLEASKSNTTSDNDWQQLALDIRKLRKSLTDATSFLAAYDQRQCQAVRSPTIIGLTWIHPLYSKWTYWNRRWRRPALHPYPRRSSHSSVRQISPHFLRRQHHSPHHLALVSWERETAYLARQTSIS